MSKTRSRLKRELRIDTISFDSSIDEHNDIVKQIGKITLDDQKIATEAVNWWRGRLGSLGTDENDKNKINLSILPTIELGKKRRGKNDRKGTGNYIGNAN